MKNRATAKKFWSFEKLSVIVLSLIIFFSTPNLNAKTVMGIVIDKATGKPIMEALVILLEKEKIYATAIVNTAGMFFFTNVEIEEFDIWTRRMGYAQIRTGSFQLTKLDILNLVIKMEAADIIMSEIVVDEKAMEAYLDKVGFESRKHGLGKYLTYKDIMNKPHATVPSIIKNIPNIIVREGIGGTKIYSGRYEWQADLMPEDANKQVILRTADGLSLFINGIYEPEHNIINVLDPQDIAGIEFYASSRTVPMQYEGYLRGKGGALFIWTKK